MDIQGFIGFCRIRNISRDSLRGCSGIIGFPGVPQGSLGCSGICLHSLGFLGVFWDPMGFLEGSSGPQNQPQMPLQRGAIRNSSIHGWPPAGCPSGPQIDPRSGPTLPKIEPEPALNRPQIGPKSVPNWPPDGYSGGGKDKYGPMFLMFSVILEASGAVPVPSWGRLGSS